MCKVKLPKVMHGIAKFWFLLSGMPLDFELAGEYRSWNLKPLLVGAPLWWCGVIGDPKGNGCLCMVRATYFMVWVGYIG